MPILSPLAWHALQVVGRIFSTRPDTPAPGSSAVCRKADLLSPLLTALPWIRRQATHGWPSATVPRPTTHFHPKASSRPWKRDKKRREQCAADLGANGTPLQP